MEITIRNAVEHDAEAIALLLTELGYPQHSETVRAKLLLLQQDSTFRVFVAEVEAVIAGVIAFDVQPLFHQARSIGTIMALIVRDSFRNRGIGSALIRHIEHVATEAGCIKIAVASGVHREDAHRFYRSLGYEENTRRFVKSLSA